MAEIAELDTSFLKLIQRTPHIENLTKLLQRKGFPCQSNEESGTRFQKSRRLYDTLLQECFTYSQEKSEELKKILHNSGNGQAGELLYSLKIPKKDFLFLDTENLEIRQSDLTIESSRGKAMMQIFRAAKNGNYEKLEILLKDMALKCYHDQVSTTDVKAIDSEKYRNQLGKVLLEKKDWMDKTLLHVAVDGKSMECINIVLQIAQEAHKKRELLDAVDGFGQTALHLAIRRKYVKITKKMVMEGSHLFIKNNAGQTPIQMIFHKLPKVATFLLDTSVTVSGEWESSDTLDFNIDFGILTAMVDFSAGVENRILKRTRPEKWRYVKLQLESEESSKFEVKELPTSINASSNCLKEDEEEKELIQILPTEAKAVEIVEEKEGIEMNILWNLVYRQDKVCLELLEHPVTQTFLDSKWKRMKLLLWCTYTLLRCGVYSLYILLMYQIYFLHCPIHQPCLGEYPWSVWTLSILPPILIFNTMFFIHEVVKAADWGKFRHFKRYIFLDPGPQVLSRLLLLSIVLATCLPPLMGRPLEKWQYVAATIGILLSSAFMLQVVGNSNCDIGIHSIYVHVYGKVMLRFLSVLLTFSPLILSFSLAFNIMYPQLQEFSSFFRSLFRLIIMLQGEFDFENKMYTPAEDSPGANNELLFWSGQLLFSVLGCVLTLVLIDVFLGYTVSDINELKKQAEFVRRCNQVSQMGEAERLTSIALKIFPSKMKRRIKDYFNLVSTKRRQNQRTDVVVSYEELDEKRQTQFRTILVNDENL